jgi:hypothetical protein
MKWYNLPQDAPLVWQALIEVNTEMHRLMPWLLAEKRSQDTLRVNRPFAAWSRRVGDRRIVMIVNLSDTPASLKLDLSAIAPRRILDWATQQPIEENLTHITRKLAGYDVSIWELQH